MFDTAPEAELLAVELIPKHHPHLEKARISYLYTDQVLKHGGKVISGKARKATDLVQYFGDVDFVVIVSKPMWAKMSDHQRAALVDHELCHCDRKETKSGVRWVIRPHDVEEFTEIIQRYGMWHRGLREFMQASSGQVEMFGDLPAPTGQVFDEPEEEEETGEHEGQGDGGGHAEPAGEDTPRADPGSGARPEDPPF